MGEISVLDPLKGFYIHNMYSASFHFLYPEFVSITKTWLSSKLYGGSLQIHAALIWIFPDYLPLNSASFSESTLLVIVSVSPTPSTKAYDVNSQSDIRFSHEADSFKECKAV